MSDKTNIPDQDDILATNERLHGREHPADRRTERRQRPARNRPGGPDHRHATAADLAGRVATLEMATKVAGEELTRLKAENATLTAKMADFNKAVAAEVRKLGLNPKAGRAQGSPGGQGSDPDPARAARPRGSAPLPNSDDCAPALNH